MKEIDTNSTEWKRFLELYNLRIQGDYMTQEEIDEYITLIDLVL